MSKIITLHDFKQAWDSDDSIQLILLLDNLRRYLNRQDNLYADGVSTPIDVEDLISEAMATLRLKSNDESFRIGVDQSVENYLRRACFLLLQTRRKEGARRKNLLNGYPDTDYELQSKTSQQERLKELEELVLSHAIQLPYIYREPFLFRMKRYSYQQIAEELGIEPATARKQVSRAKVLLQKSILPQLSANLLELDFVRTFLQKLRSNAK